MNRSSCSPHWLFLFHAVHGSYSFVLAHLTSLYSFYADMSLHLLWFDVFSFSGIAVLSCLQIPAPSSKNLRAPSLGLCQHVSHACVCLAFDGALKPELEGTNLFSVFDLVLPSGADDPNLNLRAPMCFTFGFVACLDADALDRQRSAVVSSLVYVHKSVQSMMQVQLRRTGRSSYVTPR